MEPRRIIRRSCGTRRYWSAPGDHEFGTGGADSPTQSGPYYDFRTFQTAGEAGSVPSGTEADYSFDYGNVHAITLDSLDTSRTAPSGCCGAPMSSD
jgi:hypothetical protein